MVETTLTQVFCILFPSTQFLSTGKHFNPLRAIVVYRRQRSRFLTTTVFHPMQPELPMPSIDVM